MPLSDAQQEKRSAALSSVAAALALAGMKLLVGILTNSLGILAEAAHSTLDLGAALVTYVAVRVSDRPADASHHFGHGKVENLSALFETVLLLATSVWILHEGYVRLFVQAAEVDPSIWAFLVMGISIVVDYSRSRMLSRAAKKHHSQALEADALHFSTDIWSSAVVILGLICVLLARSYPSVGWLSRADAIAAMMVALIVAWVSGELGARTLKALLDTAPPGLADQVIREVKALEGVEDCHRVRIRPSGPRYFVDLHVTMDGSRTLEETHALAEVVEDRIHDVLPDSDVTVHVEPAQPGAVAAPPSAEPVEPSRTARPVDPGPKKGPNLP